MIGTRPPIHTSHAPPARPVHTLNALVARGFRVVGRGLPPGEGMREPPRVPRLGGCFGFVF
nr:MAG TPA: GTP Cyclohydrolase I [Caudoviricetes sp.]